MLSEKSLVRHLLIEIVNTIPDVLSIDPKWLIGTLKDQYNPRREPQHSNCIKEINGLSNCLLWGVVEEIISNKSKTLDRDKVLLLLDKLVSQYGIQEDLALWCLESWCQAMTVEIDVRNIDLPQLKIDPYIDKPVRIPANSYLEQLFDDYVSDIIQNTPLSSGVKLELTLKGKQLGLTEDQISTVISNIEARVSENYRKLELQRLSSLPINIAENEIQTNKKTIEEPIISSDINISENQDIAPVRPQLSPEDIKIQYEKQQETIKIGTKWVNDGGWWMFGHDPKHSRRSPVNGPNSVSLKWKFKTGNGIYSSPSIAPDSTIYIGSKDEHLYAINSNGTIKWKYKTDRWIYSSPAIGVDGVVYFGSGDGKLYALNPDGKTKWILELGDTIQSSPVIDTNGVIYIGCRNKQLFAVDPDGIVKWVFTAEEAIFSSPAISVEGVIYFGCDDYNLYAINSNGSLIWTYTTEGRIWSSPSINKYGIVYFGSRDGRLYALLPTGKLLWKFCTGDWLKHLSMYSSPAIGFDGSVYIGSEDKHLYVIKPDGTLKWSFNAGEAINSSPSIDTDGVVYFGSLDHKIYAVDPTGHLIWSFQTDNELYSSPTIGPDGTLYIGSFDGFLYALECTEKTLQSPFNK